MLKTLLKIVLLKSNFLSKKNFSKPPQNNFMIYTLNLCLFGIILKKYEIYNVRGEEVNVYLILYTIIKMVFLILKRIISSTLILLSPNM